MGSDADTGQTPAVPDVPGPGWDGLVEVPRLRTRVGGVEFEIDPTSRAARLLDPLPPFTADMYDLPTSHAERLADKGWTAAEIAQIRQGLRAGCQPADLRRGWKDGVASAALVLTILPFLAVLYLGIGYDRWGWGSALIVILFVAAVSWKVTTVTKSNNPLDSWFLDSWFLPVSLRRAEVDTVNRAVAAVTRVRSSKAWSSGALDWQRNLIDLRQQLATIKIRCVDIEYAQTQVNALTGTPRVEAEAVLAAVRASLETRVKALDDYAWHVGELDEHLRNLENVEKAEGVADLLLDLVAKSAADACAVQHIEALTASAKAAADGAKAALAAARADVLTIAELTGTAAR